MRISDWSSDVCSSDLVDLMDPLAAAGEADVGHQGLARAVHDTADDGDREGRGDVGQPLLQHAHGLDHIELLTGAGRAGDDVDAAMAQAERLEDVEAGDRKSTRLNSSH